MALDPVADVMERGRGKAWAGFNQLYIKGSI